MGKEELCTHSRSSCSPPPHIHRYTPHDHFHCKSDCVFCAKRRVKKTHSGVFLLGVTKKIRLSFCILFIFRYQSEKVRTFFSPSDKRRILYTYKDRYIHINYFRIHKHNKILYSVKYFIYVFPLRPIRIIILSELSRYIHKRPVDC